MQYLSKPHSLFYALLAAGVVSAPAARLDAQAKDYGVRVAGDDETIAKVDDATMARALAKFGKLRDRQQKKVLESVRDAVAKLDDPHLRSLRGFAEREQKLGKKAAKPRYKPLRVGKKYSKSDTARKDSSALVDQLPFRSKFEYRWAYGDIAEHQIRYDGRRLSKKKRQRRDTQMELEDLCKGYPLDVGQALAGMMRDLDNERSADRHAVFLNSWHNGTETFYQALARAAGGREGVFCYDTMLGDWVRSCVGKKHPEYKSMIKSLDASQQAFYRMASTYRSYRGLREMVALSLVLPSDQRLPESLARLYQDNAGQGYSTRDNIILLLAAHVGDVDATVKTILNHLESMPIDTWHAGFQPVHGIYAAFKKLMPKLVAGGLHTDKVLALKKLESKTLQDRISQIARAALVKAMPMRG